MPDVKITIGGREFDVACQEGEEHFLTSAAAMLDTEAAVLVSQIRHLTEARMLLMAGLMLADKTAGLDDQLKIAQARIAELEGQLAEAGPVAAPAPVVVPAPAGLSEDERSGFAEIAARLEAIAMQVEEKASA